MKSVYLTTLLIAHCLVATTLRGQAIGENQNVSISFSVLSWQKTIRDLYFQNANGEEVNFFAPNGSPSKSYRYFGPDPVVFYRKNGADALGNDIKKPVAIYHPSSEKEQLLLFIPQPKKEHEAYRVLPLNFSREELTNGSYRFYNLATYPVYVRFGKDKFKVNSNDSVTMASGPTKANGLDIAMAMQVSAEPNSARIVYSSRWTLRSGRSALVFITNDSGATGQIDVKRIYF